MKRSSLLLGILSALILLYAVFWFYLTNTMIDFLKRIDNQEYATGYSISMGEITKYGFPFKFGVKISSLIENGPNSTITYNTPISFDYNLLRQGFYLEYKGSSVIKDKTQQNASGILLEAEIQNFIGCPLSLSLLEVLKDKNRAFELMNFITSGANIVKFKAYDSVSSTLLFDAEYNIKGNIKYGAYYKNKNDLMQSSAINHLHIESKIISRNHNDSLYTSSIAIGGVGVPPSLILGLVPIMDVNSTTSLDVSFPFLNPFGNMECKMAMDGSSIIASRDSFSLYMKSNFSGSNGTLDLVIKDNTDLKEGFIDTINEAISFLSASAANAGAPKMIAEGLQNIGNNPEKYKLPKVDAKTMNMNIDVSIKAQNNIVDVDLRAFDFLIDSTGIKVSNKTHFDDKFIWTTEGVLSVSNYDSMFDYISGYLRQVSPDIIDADRANIQKRVTSELLKYISNHPESQNPEVFLSYSGISSGADGFKVGNYNIPEIVDLYQRMLYAEALKLAKSDPNFVQKAPLLIPELSENKEVMKKLEQASQSPSAN